MYARSKSPLKESDLENLEGFIIIISCPNVQAGIYLDDMFPGYVD